MILMGMSATILYVEDNKDNRLLVRRILQAEGYNVIEADDAKLAFDVLQSKQPDLILMDINLPEVDGYTLTTQLKSNPHFEHIPIVALTANVMNGNRAKCLEAGMDDHIVKPVKRPVLVEVLDKWITTGAVNRAARFQFRCVGADN